MQFFLSYIFPPLISLVFGLISAFVIAKINQKIKKEEEERAVARKLEEEQRAEQLKKEDEIRKKEMIKREKEHQAYLAQREQERRENTRNLIREELEPILREIADLHIQLQGCVDTETQHISAIRVSYRYRLITLCRVYLRQGFITPDQFEQLNEFYNVYRNIGGNGQAEEYYNKVMALKIVSEEEAE